MNLENESEKEEKKVNSLEKWINTLDKEIDEIKDKIYLSEPRYYDRILARDAIEALLTHLKLKVKIEPEKIVIKK